MTAESTGLHRAVEMLGRPWTMLILHRLGHRPLRFTELAAHLQGISTNLLTERLRALTAARLVERVPTGATSSYTLTEHGRRLLPILTDLACWGRDLPRT